MDREEVLRLYDAYAQDVFRLALSYLHSRQEAEDVCQSVFVKLLSCRKPPDAGKEKPWLLTCAANACKEEAGERSEDEHRRRMPRWYLPMKKSGSCGLRCRRLRRNIGRWCICITTKAMRRMRSRRY